MAYYEYIKNKIEKVLIYTAFEDAPVKNYRAYYFLNEKTALLDGYIYLSDISTALDIINRSQPSDALIIIGGQSTPGERNLLKKACVNKIPYICSSSSVFQIGNKLNDIFKEEASISSTLVDIRKTTNELEEVTNAVSSICKCAALLMNMSGYILHSSGSDMCDSSWLKTVLSNGYLDTPLLRSLGKSSEQKPNSPAINETYGGLELYYSRIVSNGYPHLCMLLISNKPIEETDVLFLFTRIQSFISSYIMSRHKEGFYESHSAFHAFISDMKNHRLRGGQNIYRRLFSLEFTPPKDTDFLIRLGLIKFSATSKTEGSIPYNMLLTQLRNIFPNTNITAFSDEIQMLFFIPRTGDHVEILKHIEGKRELNDLLESYDCYLTFSRAFDGLSNINTHYNLLLRLQELAPALEKGRILTFHENMDILITSFFVSYFCQDNPPKALADYLHPDVANLWLIDSKENNNLSDVLYHYLLNDRSLQKTAAATFVHRNTVAYKINQIVNLTNIDFDDSQECQIILASCKLLKYMTRVMHVFPSNGPMRRELQSETDKPVKS